ncbi:MAG: hypothetical protein ACPHXR_04890 [Flavicella sp.]
MNKDRFTSLLRNTVPCSNPTLMELEKLTHKHPYFQAAKVLYLKGLKENESYKYNKVLKETAAMTLDRSVLFYYITGLKKIEIENNSILTLHKKRKSSTPKDEISKELNIGKPLNFNIEESHSFSEWLQLSKVSPIVRKENRNPNEKSLQNSDLIDRFIELNPSISRIKKDVKPVKSNFTVTNKTGLMTETLAKVYLEQKKYNSAIKAYDILILKYPEKSGYFADQIKKIEYLKNK